MDGIGLLSEILRMLEKEILVDQVGYGVLDKNTQRDCFFFTRKKEANFVKAAPQLFGPQLLKEVADHLSQVKAPAKTVAQILEGLILPVAKKIVWTHTTPYTIFSDIRE